MNGEESSVKSSTMSTLIDIRLEATDHEKGIIYNLAILVTHVSYRLW